MKTCLDCATELTQGGLCVNCGSVFENPLVGIMDNLPDGVTVQFKEKGLYLITDSDGDKAQINAFETSLGTNRVMLNTNPHLGDWVMITRDQVEWMLSLFGEEK